MPQTTTLAGRDLLSLADLSADEIASLFDLAAALKRDPAAYRSALAGRAVVLLFEKPSLRTRVTFEVGPARLGGHAMYFDHSRERIGQRESIKDYALNLERWVDAIVARVFEQRTLEQLAEHARLPVVNALSDRHHPCQALADFFTLRERVGAAGLRGFPMAYVGDGNNVCHSLMQGAARLGVHLTVVCPRGHEPDPGIAAAAQREASAAGGAIHITSDAAAVAGARAVYTDTWTSMGQESQAAERRRTFTTYQVNERLMGAAAPGAWFMHCLPAHRGEEVTDAVIDSPASIVYDQAENRMHVQNALLIALLS